MAALAGPPQDESDVEYDRRSTLYAIVLVLGALFVAIVIVAITSLTEGSRSDGTASARAARIAKLPPYWTVKRGDSYEEIAAKTGLTVDELETFNPYADPAAIQPGQRIKLRLHVPKPKPKPLGPRHYTVRTGDSYDSIARRTGHTLSGLQRLNPKLKATALQPGDRIRLRR